MPNSHFVEVFSTNLLGTAMNTAVGGFSLRNNHPLLSSVEDHLNWLDGDAFKTTFNGERRECRVFGIDSPELDSVLKVNLCVK